MTTSYKWLLCAKLAVVWLVIVPMVLYHMECCGVIGYGIVSALVAGVFIGILAWLVDRVFFTFCRRRRTRF